MLVRDRDGEPVAYFLSIINFHSCKNISSLGGTHGTPPVEW